MNKQINSLNFAENLPKFQYSNSKSVYVSCNIKLSTFSVIKYCKI